jgi:excisionase family DNA binding protein
MATPITLTPAEAAGLQKYEEAGRTALDPIEVQQALGISRDTVDKLTKSRQLPSYRIGRSVKIPIAGIKKFIAKAMAR